MPLPGLYQAPGIRSGALAPYMRAARINAANTRQTTTNMGLSSSYGITCSLWFKTQTGTDSVSMYFCEFVSSGGASQNFIMVRGSDNRYRVVGESPGTTNVSLDIRSTATITASSDWTHVMWSCDTDNATAHMYVNGSSSLTSTTVSSTQMVDLTGANVRWWYNDTAGAIDNPFDGWIADFWFKRVYTNLSVQSNREKFIKNGKPVYLGPTGLNPLGSAPEIYFTAETDDFLTNLGSANQPTLSGSAPSYIDTPFRYVDY